VATLIKRDYRSYTIVIERFLGLRLIIVIILKLVYRDFPDSDNITKKKKRYTQKLSSDTKIRYKVVQDELFRRHMRATILGRVSAP
jgi:hypothetical protein